MSDFLTVQEVADLMRCEHRTVRRAIKNGELRAAMIGGRWLIRHDDLDAWFDARCPHTPSPATARARAPRKQTAAAETTGSVARLRAMEGSRR